MTSMVTGQKHLYMHDFKHVTCLIILLFCLARKKSSLNQISFLCHHRRSVARSSALRAYDWRTEEMPPRRQP